MFLAPPRATSQRAGFTLLELLTVVAIIALLATLTLGVGRRSWARGKIARARGELTVLAAGLERYRRDYGNFPVTDDEALLLQALLGRRGPANQASNGPALIEVARFALEQAADPFADASVRLVDPWGRPYVYVFKVLPAWRNPSPVLYSLGPDGADEPGLLAGGYPDRTPPVNADNLYVTP